MIKDERKRVHIELMEAEYESLRQIAAERGVTVEEAAHEAIDRLIERQHGAIDDVFTIPDERRDGVLSPMAAINASEVTESVDECDVASVFIENS